MILGLQHNLEPFGVLLVKSFFVFEFALTISLAGLLLHQQSMKDWDVCRLFQEHHILQVFREFLLDIVLFELRLPLIPLNSLTVLMLLLPQEHLIPVIILPSPFLSTNFPHLLLPNFLLFPNFLLLPNLSHFFQVLYQLLMKVFSCFVNFLQQKVTHFLFHLLVVVLWSFIAIFKEFLVFRFVDKLPFMVNELCLVIIVKTEQMLVAVLLSWLG